MKHLYRRSLFSICLLVSQIAFSQNAFYEAQFLYKLDGDELKTMVNDGDDIKKQLISFTNKEKNEINNVINFLTDPFSDKLKTIDFNIVSQAIGKYNQYILDRKELEKKLVGSPLAARRSFMPNLAGGGFALSLIPNLLSGKTSISDSAQSTIIDGLTKYYAEEYKKAKTITYLKAFEATAGKIGELQILFPESYQKLKNADPSKFPDLGNEAKHFSSPP